MSESVINGFHIYHGFLSGYLSVLDKQSEMNRINVFPVSDGDTGNNVTRTIRSVILGTSPRKSAGDMMRTLAERSLEGARGNSGNDPFPVSKRLVFTDQRERASDHQ